MFPFCFDSAPSIELRHRLRPVAPPEYNARTSDQQRHRARARGPFNIAQLLPQIAPRFPKAPSPALSLTRTICLIEECQSKGVQAIKGILELVGALVSASSAHAQTYTYQGAPLPTYTAVGRRCRYAQP